MSLTPLARCMLVLLVLAQVFDVAQADVLTHSCIHDEIVEQRSKYGRPQVKVTEQEYGSHVAPTGRHLTSAVEPTVKQPLRIVLDYQAVGLSVDRDCRRAGDIVKLGEPPTLQPPIPLCSPRGDPAVFGDCWYNCTADDVTQGDKQKRLHKALEQTAKWFQQALSVEPVQGPLRLSGYSACGQDGGVQLPRQYMDEGVPDADLVLLVTNRPTTGNTLAWAVACERDQWGRAIAGHVNVAPRHLTAEAETLLSATLVHEVMHVLGFDPHAFAHFRDDRKRRRTKVVEASYDHKLGRFASKVVLPRVLMHARQHYGVFSSDFTGLELEDGGGRGTAGSHWEKRLLMNEIMTGSVDTRSVVSAMSLALLEDSGWYTANYSMAEPLAWGRSQGLQFVSQPCNQWSGAYHCNSSQSSGCTYNREAEGYCAILRYNGELPPWARYFSEANKGGQSSLADYCAYYVAYSDGSCIESSAARAPDRMLGELRGQDSRCMASSLVRNGFVRGTLVQGNGCYRHRCRAGYLEVAVDDVWKKCDEAGGPVSFPGFNGELFCPSYHELCSDVGAPLTGHCPANCHMNGECIQGRCNCFLGYSGPDCSTVHCPANCSDHGHCVDNVRCECDPGYAGVDCSTAGCDEQCSLHGGVCDNGVCEFRCSDYAGYSCQNTSALLPALDLCADILGGQPRGQHCTPTEVSVLQQLEAAVVVPNYNRLIPGGRSILSILDNGACAAAAKRLACWISIQRCDSDGDNRLRVCHSACASYNAACGARLDCSDRTLFGGYSQSGGLVCTGEGASYGWWQVHLRMLLLAGLLMTTLLFFAGAVRHLLKRSELHILPALGALLDKDRTPQSPNPRVGLLWAEPGAGPDPISGGRTGLGTLE